VFFELRRRDLPYKTSAPSETRNQRYCGIASSHWWTLYSRQCERAGIFF